MLVAKAIANLIPESRRLSNGKRRSANRRRYDVSKWIAKFSRRLILGIACYPLCTNRA